MPPNRQRHALIVSTFAFLGLGSTLAAQAATGLDAFSSFTELDSAGAPVYMSGSITGVRVTLIDLDPNDGVTPSIRFFNPSWLWRDRLNRGYLEATGAYPANDAPAESGVYVFPDASGFDRPGLLPAVPLSIRSPDGAGITSVTANTLGSSARLTNEDIAQHQGLMSPAPGQLLPVDWQASAAASADSGGANFRNDMINLGDWRDEAGRPVNKLVSLGDRTDMANFEISPMTKLVLSGVFNLKGAVNPALLAGVDPDTMWLSAYGFGHASVSRIDPNSWRKNDPSAPTFCELCDMEGAMQYQQADAALWLDNRTLGYWGRAGDPLVLQGDMSDPFELNFSNDEKEPLKGAMNLREHIYLDARGLSVPEPSTYALMGLGLIGISLVARRRQAVQA